MLKKVLLVLLVAFIVIQFIRPAKNQAAGVSANDISKHVEVPANVAKILERSCYDCHSNNTSYPWYSNIQPVAWWLNDHVVEGKAELNFSEFGSYKPKKQAHKMEEVAEMLEADEMPLKSYTLIHTNAVLNAEEKAAVITWAKSLEAQIKQANNL
jgi:hypothetical protein